MASIASDTRIRDTLLFRVSVAKHKLVNAIGGQVNEARM
jgi:hypothetical protein